MGEGLQIQDRAVVTQGVIEAAIWRVYGRGFAALFFFENVSFCLVFFICVFWFVSCPEFFLEEDVSCESASNKLQKIADTFPCYLGPMLVSFDRTWMFVGRFPVLIVVKIIRAATIASSKFKGSRCINHWVTPYRVLVPRPLKEKHIWGRRVSFLLWRMVTFQGNLLLNFGPSWS